MVHENHCVHLILASRGGVLQRIHLTCGVHIRLLVVPQVITHRYHAVMYVCIELITVTALVAVQSRIILSLICSEIQWCKHEGLIAGRHFPFLHVLLSLHP